MKIMLINSPTNKDGLQPNANYSLFPHIGIVKLATRLLLDNNLKNLIDIKIVDGGIVDLDKIFKQLESFAPDLVGISVLTPTYMHGLGIARLAKELGAKVVVGNDHAIFFAKEILKNRPYIDFVISNDVGEEPFYELVRALLNNESLEKVSSLVYRQNEVIKSNHSKKYFLNTQNIIPDLALIKQDLEIYKNNYSKIHGYLHDNKGINIVTINNARGCENKAVRCSYCSIADLNINLGNPNIFWETIRLYHNKFGINLFFEVYDSFTASPLYIKQLLAAMPQDMKIKIENGDIEFMVYARSSGIIRNNIADSFVKLGVRRVNIGLDSGDPTMLEAQRKNKTTNETNILALQLLNAKNITVHGSYILGAPGETQQSVECTMKHIKEAISCVQFSSLEVSRLFPLPNSPIWDIMVNFKHPSFFKDQVDVINFMQRLNIMTSKKKWDEISCKYVGQDLFYKDELMSDWYENFTHVDQEYIVEQLNSIDNYITSKKIQTGKNVG